MFGRKKDKEKKEKKIETGSLGAVVELTKTIFKKRDLKIEKRKITKEDKKAAIFAILIFFGIIAILWFVPFTHQFMEDVIFLRI